MNIEVLPSAEAVALRAAAWLAHAAREAVALRGVFTLAVSGGSTPGPTLRALAEEDVPWHAVHIFQVDERIAPFGHQDRNWTHLQTDLIERVPLPHEHAHPMPVDHQDLDVAAGNYADLLATICGSPIALDVVQLGLGGDGHTASLPPGDPVLDVTDRDVAITAPFAGYRRMTLTYTALDRARQRLWIVTSASKAAMLKRLVAADATIPAGRVNPHTTTVIADAVADPSRRER